MAGAKRLRAALATLFQESWKYLIVSIVALGVDTALFTLALHLLRAPLWLAVASGFGLGVLVNYALSVRFVFHEHRVGDRTVEFLGFVAIGVAGLGVKEVVIHLLAFGAGLEKDIANVLAVGVTFVFNFGLRRALLFSAARRSRSADA